MASKRRASTARQRARYDRATRKARAAERVFVRAVALLQKSIVLTYEKRLDPLVRKLSTDAKNPAGASVKALEKLVKVRIAPKVSVAYARMAEAVDAASEEYAVTLGIGSSVLSKGVREQIETRRDESIRLVEDAHRRYAADVRAVFGDPENTGLRVEVLQAKLLERGNVSISQAELVARDQTTKLLGGLNQARQVEAGITEYIWSTSRDERVRDEHAERDGQKFSWDDPPEDGHPGEPIQCRCSATPVLSN